LASKSYHVEAPLAVGLPGTVAGALAVALDTVAVRVTAGLLAEEGPRVEVIGAGGSPGKAAYAAALGLLDLLGEEATVRLRMDMGQEYPAKLLSPAAAAASLAAVSGLLGVAPDPHDVMRVANTAIAEAEGRPMPPHVAAILLGGVAVGVETPHFMASVGGEGLESWVIGIVEPCKPPSLPEICTAADRYIQLLQAAVALAASIASRGWRVELAGLLKAESPWDYAAPNELREAAGRAREAGAHAAGLDPYTNLLIIVSEADTAEDAVGRAASVIAARQGCKPKTYTFKPRLQPLLAQQVEAEG
jgi:hypothetical protein